MIKKCLVFLLLVAFSLSANETVEQQLVKCEKAYDSCANVCEKNENVDFTECITACEKVYYQCQIDVDDSNASKKEN